MVKHLYRIVVIGISVFVASCSSISSRIKENQHLFNTYAPETQLALQNGNIDNGYTQEMVYIAKGNPDFKSSRKDVKGKTRELWKYATSRSKGSSYHEQRGQGLSSPFSYPNYGSTPATMSPAIYDREYQIIEFESGKVVDYQP